YNNQDHAMMTAMLTAENILVGERRWDVWRVNGDGQYIEVDERHSVPHWGRIEERLVPRRINETRSVEPPPSVREN
ncbi:MAG: hypothetical protein ACHREM_24320, partial [Polyangiales bacterium]